VLQVSPAFTVEEFEFVEAGPGLALLRLSGAWHDAAPEEAVPLVALSGGQRLTLAALPAPPSADGAWRAAYSASPELLRDPGAAFELEPAAGAAIPLPRPVEHGASDGAVEVEAVEVEAVEVEAVQPAPPASEPPRAIPEERPVSRIFGRRRQQAPQQLESHAALMEALAAERHARQAAERIAAEEHARAQHAEAVLADELRSTVGKTEELIARIDGYEHGRVSFEEELDAVRRTHADLLAETEHEHRREVRGLREQLAETQRELSTANDELDAANHHIDTLNDAHSLELGAARSQRDTAERQLAEARATIEGLRARLEDREALIELAREEAAVAHSESEDLQLAVVRLRDAIAVRVRDAATAPRRFTRDPEELDRSREELRRDAERITALERQAEALRDAIHSQLPYSLHASPLQEALPVGEPEDPQVEEALPVGEPEETQVDA
jgi:hypothetical protein